MGQAKFVGPHKVKYGLPGRVDVGGEVTARDIIIATGSVPFVPPGACRGIAPAKHACTFMVPSVRDPFVVPPCPFVHPGACSVLVMADLHRKGERAFSKLKP